MQSDRLSQTDEALHREFAAGRRDALGDMARRHERALLGLACGLLGGRRALACDAVQETWVRVMRFASGFRDQSTVKTWLYRILVNQCRSIRETEQMRFATATAGSDAPADQSIQAAEDGGPQQNERLRGQVDRLDAEKRVVLLLCYHEGLTHEHAAEILGLPLGTLKSRLHSALSELRAALRTREAV